MHGRIMPGPFAGPQHKGIEQNQRTRGRSESGEGELRGVINQLLEQSLKGRSSHLLFESPELKANIGDDLLPRGQARRTADV